MGLDMWLRAQSKLNPEGTEQTGACSGLFGLIALPDENHNIELGYWRKAYDQRSLILDSLASYKNRSKDEDGFAEENCIDFVITSEEIDDILEAVTEILATHTFDEDGFDISDNYDGWDTWNSKSKWEDTKEYFLKAKALLEEDPEAKVYFCQWY